MKRYAALLNKTLMLILFCVPLLGGCSTVKKQPFQEIKNLPPGTALIYFYRPKKFDMNPELADIYVNKRLVAKSIDKGEYTHFFTQPGEQVIRIHPVESVSKDVKFRLIAERGNVYYIRLIEWIVYDPKEVPQEEALKELAKCVHL